jgi:hypothetical protein
MKQLHWHIPGSRTNLHILLCTICNLTIYNLIIYTFARSSIGQMVALVTQTTAIYAEDDRKIGFLETLHFFCPKLVEKQKVA